MVSKSTYSMNTPGDTSVRSKRAWALSLLAITGATVLSQPGFAQSNDPSPSSSTSTSPGKIQPYFPRGGPQLSDTKVDEDIALTLPSAQELMPVGADLPVIKLEASYNQPVALKDVVNFAALNNLAIGISREQMYSQKWLLIGALGRYFPDALMLFRTQFIAGSTLIQGIIPASFATPNAAASAGYRFTGFQGGRVLFGALAQKHNYLASKATVRQTINDILLLVATQYYELVRAQAFLDIRVRAVETSRAQLLLNQQLERAGTGTYFNVLQADTQLASDELQLLRQEVAFRTAAITLARTLNIDMGANLMTVDSRVRKIRIIDPAMDINGLMRVAIKYRPELKKFEELRLAARRNIQVAAAPLYPSMVFYGSYQGNGATLGPGYRVQPGSFQTAPITSGGPTATTASGNPVFPVGATFTPAQQVKRQMRSSYTIGMEVDWNYPNAGVPDVANVQSNKHIARQAMLQANQQFLDVLEQVRKSYLNSLISEREIDVASRAVASSSEQLRLARVRLANGVGTNIDVLQAQQVWVQSLITKADAILKFNVAQVQLLRDLGVISVDSLTSGRLVRE